ncbi:MAG: glycosyltransferase family 4 protein [candidate division FCPU426 bacterium]
MSAKKILYADFYSFLGGGQINLLSLFKAMDRQRYSPILVLSKEGPFAQAARALKVPVFFVPMGKARWRRPWEALPAFFRLRRLMAEEKVDLVHCNCYPVNKLAALAARSLGIPSVWHKQIGVTQRPGSSTGALWRFFSRFNDRVLAVSRQGFEALKALGIQENKLVLFYNNADMGRFASAKPLTPAALKRHKIPSGLPLVLAAGMRRHHKGFDTLLEAMIRVQTPCYLALLGDPAQSESGHESLLRRLASAPELQGRLSVLPAQADLAPWFKSAALFVSSSRLEGSPLVVIEAMAAGCAIVATRQASGELIEAGRSGWLCDAEDPEGMARSIDAALGSPSAREKMGKAAREVAEQRFSLTRYATDMASLYDGICQ